MFFIAWLLPFLPRVAHSIFHPHMDPRDAEIHDLRARVAAAEAARDDAYRRAIAAEAERVAAAERAAAAEVRTALTFFSWRNLRIHWHFRRLSLP